MVPEGSYWLIEKKGQEDIAVAHRDRAVVTLCRERNPAHGNLLI